MERTRVLVAGAGVIGSSIACALAERGVRDVSVVDVDLAGRYASSELNAGGARATWWQAVNVAACRDTLAFFGAHAEELSFRRAGYLWLYADAELWAKAREARSLQARLGVEVELLAPAEVSRRFPIVDRSLEELVGATFSPSDGLLNPNALRRLYQERAIAGGARFLRRHHLDGIEVAERAPGVRAVERVDFTVIAKGDPADEARVIERILTQNGVPREAAVDHVSIRPDVFVNALGAWSPIVSARLGVHSFSQPVRRQISIVDVRAHDVPQGVDLHGGPMIVDASGVYFHPEGPYTLAGYSNADEPAGYRFDYDGDEFFEREIWPRLAHRAASFERAHHVRGWAGLYAVTPDCSGVLGPIAGFANAIEAHSFTGRGVMQSRAIGVGVAELICDGRYRALDLSPLSPARFAGPPDGWLREDLHI
ncbi:MAG TPA: FAD-binding oxidoreductase [Myxococcota bacterium]|nr:FAD-binding oxidoreductase [Myxococcota bacterium]